MDWILRNVAVGSWEDASPANQSLLKSEKVGAILNVRSDENDASIKKANEREWKYCSYHNIGYCHIRLKDCTVATDDQLATGVAFIDLNVKSGRNVLVHCGAGMGRAPSFVAAYLLFKKESKDAKSAIELIQKRRPGCFEDCDEIHIPRLIEFEKKLPAKRAQIASARACPRCGNLLDEEEFDNEMPADGLPEDRENQFMEGEVKLYDGCWHDKEKTNWYFLEFPDGVHRWYEWSEEYTTGWQRCRLVRERSQKTLGKWVRKRKTKKQNRSTKANEKNPDKGRSL